MDIGKSIRIGLANKNESKTWLAKKLGVTPQYIGQFCNGVKEPKLKTVKIMADIFGVTASEFIKWGE